MLQILNVTLKEKFFYVRTRSFGGRVTFRLSTLREIETMGKVAALGIGPAVVIGSECLSGLVIELFTTASTCSRNTA